MRTLTIAITGINACDNPAPGVGIAKSLKEAPGFQARTIGLAYDAMEPGIYLDQYIDRSFLIPYPVSGPDALLHRLQEIHAIEPIDVLLPNLDSDLPNVIAIESTLHKMGIRVFLPTEEQFCLRDKQHLRGAADLAGIDMPQQAVVKDQKELHQATQDIGVPVMVKGSVHSASRANSLQEAITRFTAVVARWGYPVLVQEVVIGEEMNVIGVGDGHGRALGMVAIKKMNVTELGKIWTGVTVSNQRLLEAAERFVAATQWRGPFEVECIISGDQVYLIEINPRFPAWVYFATGVGSNLPALLVDLALGCPITPPEGYPTGKLYIRYTDERVCDMARMQQLICQGESA